MLLLPSLALMTRISWSLIMCWAFLDSGSKCLGCLLGARHDVGCWNYRGEQGKWYSSFHILMVEWRDIYCCCSVTKLCLFATPWTPACKAPLSSTISQKVKVKSFSHVRLFATPWTVAHGIFQARVLEWVAISLSRESSWPRDQTQVSRIAGGGFTSEPRGKTLWYIYLFKLWFSPDIWPGMGLLNYMLVLFLVF